MKPILILSLITLILCGHSKDEWRGRSIYQLLTDRFSNDNSIPVNCNLGNYCGGTFKGIMQHLDYIKGIAMGEETNEKVEADKNKNNEKASRNDIFYIKTTSEKKGREVILNENKLEKLYQK